MIESGYNKQVIIDDDDQYNIPDSIEATFVNVGDVDVLIDEYPRKKGETFRVGAIGHTLTSAKVSIQFQGKGKRKLLLFYNYPKNC